MLLSPEKVSLFSFLSPTCTSPIFFFFFLPIYNLRYAFFMPKPAAQTSSNVYVNNASYTTFNHNTNHTISHGSDTYLTSVKHLCEHVVVEYCVHMFIECVNQHGLCVRSSIHKGSPQCACRPHMLGSIYIVHATSLSPIYIE